MRRPEMCRATICTQRCLGPAHGSTVRWSASCGVASWATPWTSTVQPVLGAGIDRVGLEGDRMPEEGVELHPVVGAEDDGLAVEDVVHGDHERQAVRGDHGEPADHARGEQLPALLPREHVDARRIATG